MAITLGSLFDGIGVFPLAASNYGIVPLWASEIEKVPISITKKHFPQMQHLGDITKLDGAKIPPVHIITFGSPCQNLSTIGAREGLAGAKSGLFHHAIRIIQEMRCATDGKYPVMVEKYARENGISEYVNVLLAIIQVESGGTAEDVMQSSESLGLPPNSLDTESSIKQAKAGDLVFFHSTYNAGSYVTHVGIYVGNNQMYHAGDPIGYADLSSSYWQQHLIGAGRVKQ